MLNQAQLNALFKRIADGTDTGGAFAAATPELTEEDRNRYVNQYGVGGTNYGEWSDWYKANQAALNRDKNPAPWQPGGIFNPNPGGGGVGPGTGGGIMPVDAENPWLGGKTASSVWTPTPLTDAKTAATSMTGWSGATSAFAPGATIPGAPGMGGEGIVQAQTNTPLRPTPTPGVTPRQSGPGLRPIGRIAGQPPGAPGVVSTVAPPPPIPTVGGRPGVGAPRAKILRGVWQ